MLPDFFVFQIDSTGELYQCIRRADGCFDLQHNNHPDDEPSVWTDEELNRFIGDGWTIVSTNEDETDIDIQNLI